MAQEALLAVSSGIGLGLAVKDPVSSAEGLLSGGKKCHGMP